MIPSMKELEEDQNLLQFIDKFCEKSIRSAQIIEKV